MGSRTLNASRNLIFGALLKAYQTLLPFVIRTVMIYYLGMEYVGLNSLFASVLQALNLAELGVGSAMAFSMYKPIVDNDEQTLCALLQLYKRYYRIIGGIILGAGLLLMPFIPDLINGEVPGDMNVYVLYLLNLLATVCSYWLFAYKNSLLTAYQRSDVISKLQIIVSTIQYGLQILTLIFIKNYYVFLAIALGLQLVSNVATAVMANRMYPQIQPKGELEKNTVRQINQRVKDLFTARVRSMLVDSTGAIVISAVLGLTALAVYQNYFYILSAVFGFAAVMFKAVLASVGNSMIANDMEKNYEDFQTISFLCVIVFGVCTSCFLCLFQPFITLWVGEENLLGFGMVILFCVYFMANQLTHLFTMYKDAAGIWHEDRVRPLVEVICNLVLCLILVQFLGLYGILIAMIISTGLISLPWLIRNLFRYVFKRNGRKFAIQLIMMLLLLGLIAVVTGLVCSLIQLEGFLGLALKAMVCVLCSGALHLLVFSRFSRFADAVRLLDKVTGGRIPLPKSIKEK